MAFADLIGEGNYAIAAGQRKLTNIQTGRKVPQYIDKIVYRFANVAPLYALTRKLGKKKVVKGASFFHLEADRLPGQVEVTGTHAYDDTALTLTTDHGKRIVAGMELQLVRTGEMMLVASGGGSSDSIVVTRGHKGTTTYQDNLVEDDELQIVGSCFAEGATAPAGISAEPSIVTNYVQTFRQAIEASGRDLQQEVFGPAEQKRILEDAGEALMLQVEKMLMFSTGLSSTDPTGSAGFPYWATTGVTNAGGALDEDTFRAWIKRVSRYNEGKMSSGTILFAGELVRDAIEGWARDNLVYHPDDKLVGVQVGRYQCAYGNVAINPHPLLSAIGTNVGATPTADAVIDGGGSPAARAGGWAGKAYFINLENIGRAVFAGRDWHLRPDIETPGTDGKKWEYLTDEGLWMANERSHAILYGVTG